LHSGKQSFCRFPISTLCFTLSQQTGRLALQNAKPIYNLLFHAASRALLETAADPRLLGASIGFLAVLHTWGQNLHFTPAPALRRTGRRHLTRRLPLDRLPQVLLLPTRARAQQPLSEDLLAIPPVGIPERHAPLPW